MKQISAILVCLSLAAAAHAQQPPPPAQPPAAAAPAATEPALVPAPTLNLNNASLTEVVDLLCRALKLNYILDPSVKGAVSINTYGETRNLDARSLLDMILRLNGATMVKVGDLYRIVPMADAQRLPIPLQSDLKNLPDDDATVLALIFLRYATVGEVSKLMEPFLGVGARVTTYEPANLMFVLDSRRSVRRALDLISMFDSDALANQRVRIYDLENSSPTDMAKELETILKSISLTEKSSIVRFLPIDHLNMLIAVAPNPGAFDEIDTWIKRLDAEPKASATGTSNYVYRVKYSRAEVLASVITQLYGGAYNSGQNGFGGGGFGAGGGGVGVGGGGFGGGGFGQTTALGAGGAGGVGVGQGGSFNQNGQTLGPNGVGGLNAAFGGPNQTGLFQNSNSTAFNPNAPRVVPNQVDNSLIVQASPSEWKQIEKVLHDVDVPPRQVLIEAKIYEVTMAGAFQAGVSSFLSRTNAASPPATGVGTAQITAAGAALTATTLVGQTRQLLSLIQLAETRQQSKVISAPSIIATDSIAASLNVGTDVPTLTSQAVSGVQSGGTSQFANTISSRSTGVQLSITARVTQAGVVTMFINQEVSAPVPPDPSGIQSPSFSRRTVNTQVTVQDGDTIAIAGIIQETSGISSAGLPVLHRIPIIGSAFGSRSSNKGRTETVIFITPRVIFDTNSIQDASEEITSKFRKLQREIRNGSKF
jgi:general secretion pathway protein D